MREYEGAVLFVDLLGVGELTSGESITITSADYSAIRAPKRNRVSNQTYCALLLSIFRRNLRSVRQRRLKIAQLSDCAFIWSKDPNLVLTAARRLMWRNLKSGLLCRAGLSYGQIVEPVKVDKQIGQFVCGDAVTRSANLERQGKGARIFVDTELPGLVGLDYPVDAFSDLRNASDYRKIDEFKWFTYQVAPSDFPSPTGAVAAINDIIGLIALLWHSPRYRWNASVIAGRLQMGSTIERLSEEIAELAQVHSLNLVGDFHWRSESFVIAANLSRSDKAVKGFVKANRIRKLPYADSRALDGDSWNT